MPGTGPRGAIGRATLTGAGAAPDHVQRALTEASRGTVGTAIGRCHADGIERGADPEGDVVVRLVIDRASGRVRESDVELSTLGNRREDECIASALEQMTLPASGSGVVELSVPVRLRN